MPLTPEDVQNKRFSTVRFKEGYDEEEVDAFLDEVEAELRRLLGEDTDLRSSPAAAAPPLTAQPPVAQPPVAQPPAHRPRTPAKRRSARCCWHSAPPTRRLRRPSRRRTRSLHRPRSARRRWSPRRRPSTPRQWRSSSVSAPPSRPRSRNCE